MPQALGTAISTASVVPIYYAMMAASQRRLRLPRVDGRTMFFMALAGITSTAGTLFQFAALKMENVSIVQSLTNLNPLVAVLLLVLLGTEKVSRNLVIGTLLVVAGSILVITR